MKVVSERGPSVMRTADDSCVFLLSKADYSLHHHILKMIRQDIRYFLLMRNTNTSLFQSLRQMMSLSDNYDQSRIEF